MLRVLALLFGLCFASAAVAAAPRIGALSVCDAALRACRPTDLLGADPQGREIWVVADVQGRADGAARLQLSAIAASEVWFNGVRIGSNGRPGSRAAEEVPGLLDASFPIPPHLWRADGNRLAVRMSSFHAPIRLRAAVQDLRITPDGPKRGADRWRLAPPLAAAGALLAGFLYFLPMSLLDRSRPRALLAAMAGMALVEAAAEMWRPLVPYAYPWQPVRLVVILAAAWGFSILLAAFTAQRFMARARWAPPAAVAVAGVAVVLAFGGFDERTALTLASGAAVSLVPALIGVRRGVRGGWLATACLLGVLGLLFGAPQTFLDLSLFLVAAALTLAFLVAEVLRLRRVTAAREGELVRAASHPDHISVATAKGVELVRLERIVAIVGADDYAELRLSDGRALLHAARLDQLEAALPTGFLRTHRSAIVNLAHAERLARHGGRWVLEPASGPALPIARARLAAVRAAVGA